MNLRFSAALVGATGILAAAFGAHGLEAMTDPRGLRHWAIGAGLQLVTAPALLALAGRGAWGHLCGTLLTFGILLFSGSLYLLALGAPKFLGAVTPVGGLLLFGGWLGVAFSKSPDGSVS